MLPLICIDVDGTLVGPTGAPTDVVWAAADTAVARGQHLALSTARGAFGATYDYAKRLDPAGWHIFHAGAALVHTGTGASREHALSRAAVDRATRAAEEHGWVLEYYSTRDYTVASRDELAIAHAALLGVDHVVRDVESLAGSIVRVQFVVPVGEVDATAAAMDGMAAVTTATSPGMPGAAFVSVTTPGVSKASAIREIAEELDVDIEAVMMVGDGHNDLEAVALVGHGVAMGNAEPAVKAAARHVVADVDADGLAEALALSGTLS